MQIAVAVAIPIDVEEQTSAASGFYEDNGKVVRAQFRQSSAQRAAPAGLVGLRSTCREPRANFCLEARDERTKNPIGLSIRSSRASYRGAVRCQFMVCAPEQEVVDGSEKQVRTLLRFGGGSEHGRDVVVMRDRFRQMVIERRLTACLVRKLLECRFEELQFGIGAKLGLTQPRGRASPSSRVRSR